MCLFNNDVPDPTDTLIFVSTTRDNRQLTIYQNKISAQETNIQSDNSPAMILPFPIKNNKQIILIDLSSDANILNDLNNLYPRKNFKGYWHDDNDSGSDSGELEVQEMGAYNISVAYSLKDLRRYDRKVFTLNFNLDKILIEHYSTGFGFLICAFDPKKTIDTHPIAYIHELRPDGYFIPTRHYHDSDKDVLNDYASFDHSIFTVNSQYGKEASDQIAARKIISVDALKKYLPKNILIKREELHGEYVNEDLIYDYKGCKEIAVDISSL